MALLNVLCLWGIKEAGPPLASVVGWDHYFSNAVVLCPFPHSVSSSHFPLQGLGCLRVFKAWEAVRHISRTSCYRLWRTRLHWGTGFTSKIETTRCLPWRGEHKDSVFQVTSTKFYPEKLCSEDRSLNWGKWSYRSVSHSSLSVSSPVAEVGFITPVILCRNSRTWLRGSTCGTEW